MDPEGYRRHAGWAALAVLFASTPAIAGEVVIHERPDGTVVITEVPATGGDLGESDPGGPQRAGPTRPGTAPAPKAGPTSAATSRPGVPDYAIAIRDPGPEAVIWADDARVSVSVALEPGLAADHRLRVRLGDHARATAAGPGVVELHPVHRGSFTLRAEVIDGAGEVIATAEPRMIHVKQHSRLRSGTAD